MIPPTVIQEKDQSPIIKNTLPLSGIPPSVLLIGKKRALDYITPALLRINNTGELVIKATGSLSIVTAVNVAEMIKRDVENLATKSIIIGTDELVIANGEKKRMSCIEIHLIKAKPLLAMKEPIINTFTSASIIKERMTSEVATTPTVTTILEEKTLARKSRAKKKTAATDNSVVKKTATNRKKKPSV